MGKLILLNVALGNLGDISERVKESLQQGEFFAVEDTRSFRQLLHFLNISSEGKVFIAYFDHSAPKNEDRILELLEQGKTVYVVSEAGSPIISDPAYPLIRKAIEAGRMVDSYSGSSAFLVALELSGLPPYPFTFMGFFPREKKAKEDMLRKVLIHKGTSIFYETPHRIEETMECLAEIAPEVEVCCAREMTKKFQQVLRFRADDWKNQQELLTLKGEFTVVLYQEQEASEGVELVSKKLLAMARKIQEDGPRKKDVAKLVAHLLNEDTGTIYQQWAHLSE